MPEMKPVAVGQPAPNFDLPSSKGKSIKLTDYSGKQAVVLYFYPKADTPGCTKEACGFRDAIADYDKAKVAVLGISPDPEGDVTKFGEKFHLNFPLLADADGSITRSYGVWGSKTYGDKTYVGAQRTTFVIDKSGKIAHVFESVKPEGHDQEVLTWVKANMAV